MVELINPVPSTLPGWNFRNMGGFLWAGLMAGLTALAGTVAGKLSKAAVGAGAAAVNAPVNMASNLGFALGGIGSVAISTAVAPFIFRDDETRKMFLLGAWIEALNPLWSQYVMAPIKPMLPAQIQAALGSYYLTPLGSSYAVHERTLGRGRPMEGYAPDDFGADVSSNFPSLAGDSIGVSPDFNGTSQYAAVLEGLGAETILMGDGSLFQPSLSSY